jgi:methanogenic corrinoid protein MtbC1
MEEGALPPAAPAASRENSRMGADGNGHEKEKRFPIGYVALATGLSPHVIRAWERRYRAVAPQRRGKNRRMYSEDDIARLNCLKRARLHGGRIGSLVVLDDASLGRMDRDAFMSAGQPHGESAEAPRPESAFDCLRACDRAVRSMDDMALWSALERAGAQLSRYSLIEDVVAPLMHGIGDEWAAKRLGIAHEHFASNVVRGFLSRLIVHGKVDERSPLMVVSTPAGQRCEIGAMAAAATAAECGWKVFYCGPDLPVEDIAAAAASKQAEAVCLSITCRPQGESMNRDFNRLRQQLGDEVRVFIGGQASVACGQTATASNFRYFSRLADFAGFISLPGSAV